MDSNGTEIISLDMVHAIRFTRTMLRTVVANDLREQPWPWLLRIRSARPSHFILWRGLSNKFKIDVTYNCAIIAVSEGKIVFALIVYTISNWKSWWNNGHDQAYYFKITQIYLIALKILHKNMWSDRTQVPLQILRS